MHIISIMGMLLSHFITLVRIDQVEVFAVNCGKDHGRFNIEPDDVIPSYIVSGLEK